MITQERLKELCYYDLETGIFTWLVLRRGSAKAGDIAGSKHPDGYWQLRIDGKRYLAHRLAWLYVYGVLPKNYIDHKDHDMINNKITNLRDVTKAGNNQNQIKAMSNNQSTGLLGAHYHKKNNKYTSCISVNYKQIHLGCFDTAEEAHSAYVNAKRIHHETCMI